tara:strand:+ start:1329 stop:1574 length:246 start_codon:yes stop_codon:yes gene_type:complete
MIDAKTRVYLLICLGACSPRTARLALRTLRTECDVAKTQVGREPCAVPGLVEAARAMKYTPHIMVGEAAECAICQNERRYG